MTRSLQLVSGEAPIDNAFGVLLAETLQEMEAAEIMDLMPDDAVERLSLAAHHAVVSQTGGPLPRVGGHVYRTTAVTPPAQTRTQLDVRY